MCQISSQVWASFLSTLLWSFAPSSLLLFTPQSSYPSSSHLHHAIPLVALSLVSLLFIYIGIVSYCTIDGKNQEEERPNGVVQGHHTNISLAIKLFNNMPKLLEVRSFLLVFPYSCILTVGDVVPGISALLCKLIPHSHANVQENHRCHFSISTKLNLNIFLIILPMSNFSYYSVCVGY